MAVCVSLGLMVVASALAADAPRALGDMKGNWQLFVDDYLVESKDNVSLVYHSFVKDERNPILVPDRPWEEDAVYLYGTVLPGEDGKGYRAWYHAYAEGEYRMLYATSADGIHWEKPSLGLVDYKGSKDNNLLFRFTHENHNPQVMHTPWETDPNRRYKLIFFEYGRTPPNFTVCGYYGMTSPDGIHWSEVTKRPILVDSPGDVGNFVYDSIANRYVGWPKKFAEERGYRRRCIGFTETTDFESWPETELVLTPDAFDDRWLTPADVAKGAHTDFYGLCGFVYETMYLGFLWMFPITNGENDGPCFVELATCRDGKHWQREEEPRPRLLDVGKPGTWDDGMVFTPNHPLVEGDTIKLFYGGFDETHGAGKARACIGLATLRKDGFASLHAGESEGTVETSLLDGTAGALSVNYAVRDGGGVRVEVLARNGLTVPGYGLDDCVPLNGDSVSERVQWKGLDTLPQTSAPIRLRFVMTKADLYSFNAGSKARVVLLR